MVLKIFLKFFRFNSNLIKINFEILYNSYLFLGHESIYRNDKFCGYTTSTAYGYSLDKQVCLGFVHNFDDKTGEKLPITLDYLTKNAHYEIDIAGKRYKAKINLYPPNIK